MFQTEHGLKKTDSFEDFIATLSRLPDSECSQHEESDIVNDPTEESDQEAIILELNLELEEKIKLISRLERDIQKAQHDYQNCRKSLETELIKERKIASAELLRSLLPALDDFQTISKMEGSEGLIASIKLMVTNLFEILAKNGFEKINIGEYFDVSACEAIALVAGEYDGKIDEIVQEGYTLNGVILRHAKVTVYTKEIE